MKYPIGIDNFSELLNSGAVWVDKSLLIKDIIDDGSKIILLPRPRRFGKTLNLSMIQHFFAGEVSGQLTADLFKGLKIDQVEGNYLEQYQGKYPVIFLTFKGVKTNNYEAATSKLTTLIQELYLTHRSLLTSKNLAPEEKEIIRTYLSGAITQADLELSLKRLTQYLKKHYQKNAILLIDEYDAPLQAAHLNDGEEDGKDKHYRDNMISLMRGMLGEALKGNDALYKGVLTGILRIAKENIFSDLNNLSVYTILDQKYATAFGFTEEEVSQLVEQADVNVSMEDVANWYNGYRFKQNTIYNPWSIINCLARNGELRPYWVNTSSNDLIREAIQKATLRNKWLFEQLIRGETIQRTIRDHLTFEDLTYDETGLNDIGIWSLLLMSGYLTYTKCQPLDDTYECQIKLPNREVLAFFKGTLRRWLLGGRDAAGGDNFIQHLLDGDSERFERQLYEMLDRASNKDLTERTQEAFYQGLMLGCFLLLDPKRYTYDSNRESGKGYYDLAIFPKDPKKDTGAVFELKALSKKDKKLPDEKKEELLNNLAQDALQQIETKDYITKFNQQGVGVVRKVGIAFCGKEMILACNEDEE